MNARRIIGGLLAATIPTLPACSDTAAISPSSPDAIAQGDVSFSRHGGHGTVIRTTLNGEFAEYVSWMPVPGGQRYLYLNVARQAPGANAVTWLTVVVEHCPVLGECTSRIGSGPIPRADFTGNLQRGFTLETDTRTNPQFLTSPEGVGGPISVSWNPTGAVEYRQSGSTEFVSSTWSMHRSGTWRYSHAIPAGVVFDIPLVAATGSGWIGTNRSVEKAFTVDEPMVGGSERKRGKN